MQSNEPLNTRFILLVIGAVALLFGGIVGFAMTQDGSGEPAKPRTVAAARVTPDPVAERATNATPTSPAVTPARDVPPTIDTGPVTASATSTGERVPVDDIVRGPWEVVDLGASGDGAAKATAGATPATASAEKAAPKKAAVIDKDEPAPAKATKERDPAEKTAATERVPVVVPLVTPRVTIVESAIATGVTDREPIGADDAFEIGVERIWAWVKVKNDGPPTQVTMVWRKGDEVAFRYTLDIGTSPSWRTWSNKTLRAWDAGDWTVDVLDANGLRVDALHFEVEPAVAADAG